MMGFQETSARLFYDFCLDEHVPADHLLRGIDRHLDLADLRQSLKPFYSQMGRPSVDPELMIRMLIVGYSMGIRSERRLCEEVHLNLAYRWFCRLGLDGKVPDHSTFSKNRHGRFRGSDALRRLFESVVQRCIAEGLVSADGFAVDASLIAADANKQRSVPSREWKPEEIKPTATRAAQEYLATLDDAAFGAASPVTPKFISRSDPAAQWTGAHKGHAFFAYANNYLIDTDHGVIVDVEATRAIRQAEVGAARTMLERTETRFGMKPASLAADSAYGSANSLAWLVKRKEIAPHIPVFDKSIRTDGLAQHDAPAPLALLEEVVEAPGAEHVHFDLLDRGPLRDRHLGLGDRPIARQVDGDAAHEVQDADALGPAFLAEGDKVIAGALRPGGHHAPVWVPDGAEAFPVARVAPTTQFCNSSVINRRSSISPVDCVSPRSGMSFMTPPLFQIVS